MLLPYSFLSLSLLAHAASVPVQVKVNLEERFQTIDGFGISEAFQRAEQVHGKRGLSPANQKKVIELLFSDSNGAGLSIIRNGIGSSTSSDLDFMRSIAPVSPGFPNATPKYEWDNNDSGQLWFTQEAMKYGLNTVYADAWSAPAYMKTNNNDSNGGLICGVRGSSCPTGDWRQAYANYLVQYLRFYKEAGVVVTHLGFLNEPDLNQTYAAMLSDGFQAADFLTVLYPTLKAAGFGDVKLVCCEATGWDQQAAHLAELQSVPGAEDTLSVISAHGYSSDPKVPYKTPHRVWQTEWADLNGKWNTAWDRLGKFGDGMGWANKIQQALVTSNCSAFLYWIGAEDTPTNDALIRIQNDTISVTGRLWAFAQFSRFVKPGAMRVQATSDIGYVGVSAFENMNGTVAVQVINNGHVDLDISLQVAGLRKTGNMTISSWLTNNSNNVTSQAPLLALFTSNALELPVKVPSRSVVSYLLP